MARPFAARLPKTDARKLDRHLYRLLVDLEDLLDVAADEQDSDWYDWAESKAIELRRYLTAKGYVL